MAKYPEIKRQYRQFRKWYSLKHAVSVRAVCLQQWPKPTYHTPRCTAALRVWMISLAQDSTCLKTKFTHLAGAIIGNQLINVGRLIISPTDTINFYPGPEHCCCPAGRLWFDRLCPTMQLTFQTTPDCNVHLVTYTFLCGKQNYRKDKRQTW